MFSFLSCKVNGELNNSEEKTAINLSTYQPTNLSTYKPSTYQHTSAKTSAGVDFKQQHYLEISEYILTLGVGKLLHLVNLDFCE